MAVDRARIYTLYLVSLAWAFNLIAPAFISGYTTSLTANAPLLLILGTVWSTGRKGGGRGD